MATEQDDKDSPTRAELYAKARERDVPGRSNMTKDELASALADAGSGGGGGGGIGGADERHPVASRFDSFHELAQARARGEFVFLPRMMSGDDRRIHVRQTLREDHQQRIDQSREGAEEKFEKLAGSLFSFFRGTALLFYRDIAGEDAWMPTVLTLGDVHPENFGVMPSADNAPIFGVNDFDEAYYAPFTWDLKRGATGFMIAAQTEGGHGRKRQRKIAAAFVRGYLEGVRLFASDHTETDHQMRLGNSHELIADLIDEAQDEPRAEWLADDYLNEFKRGFRADEELVPISTRREEFQEIMDRYVEENGVPVPPRAEGMRVKDVCERKGQGTASLGLTRYYVLIEGPNADGTDDLIIEFKQARRSALAGLVPPSDFSFDGRGKRIAHAQGVQLVRGDVFYGFVEFEGLSFMARERSPYKEDIDLDDLSKKEWKAYARVCGRSLAHAHALSDETGEIDQDIEPEILDAVGDGDLFVDDIVRFADEAAERLRRDHAAFIEDHEMGAFRFVDHVYR